MIPTSVHAVFDGLKRRAFEPRLEGVYGSYRFDILGVGSFHVAIADGELIVRESTRPGDCIVTCSRRVFLRVVTGSQNMLTAAMQGQVQIRGDLTLAQRLHQLLPSATDVSAGDQP
jgi:putative sterol carrier protein